MAQQQQQQHQGVGLDWDQFTCSICLDLLKEPVSINCGHNYCRTCIDGCWDQEEEKGVYSCPQCRESFSPRPALRRNNMLVELLEKLKKTEVQQASSSAPLSYAGPEDVACDFCTGTRRHKAVMSCLTCLASYCDTHLQPHYSVPVLKRHKLVPATDCLQEKMCSSHNKLMEVYCRTDQQCICLLCAMDEHKGHNTVSAAAERAEKQKHLSVSQQRVQESIQERERELEELRQAVEDLKGSAQTAVEDSERIFTELISSIERRSREVKELIRDQEKTAVCRAEGLLLQLEEEIAKLRRNQTDLEKLSHTDDHIHFIQNFQSLLRPSGSPDLPSIVVGPLRYFRDVSDAVSDLRDKLENILKDTWPRISATGSWKEYETRNMSLQRNIVSSYMSSGIKDMIIYLCCFDSLFSVYYCCPLSLDHNSVYKHLSLSEENRKTHIDHVSHFQQQRDPIGGVVIGITAGFAFIRRHQTHRVARITRNRNCYELFTVCKIVAVSKMAEHQEQQQQGVGLDWDQFTCSICLDLLKEPVAINCGHSYCRTCIDGCWDQEEEKGVYSCPQCRESFSPRPALRRNHVLAELLEKLKKTEVQQASSSAPLSYAGPEDVACDFCTGTRRHKAVMSCLTCLVSYCDTHLQPHYSAPMLKRHKLVPATDCLQEKMCSSHNKLMEVYCRTDQQCICYLCAMDEHKGHNTVSAAAERAEKQKHLSVSQQRVQESIQERERELEELRQAVEDLKGSAQTAVEDSERIFTELISSIERRSREVKELIRDQEKTAVCRAEGRLLQLEEEIAKLRRNQTDLEKLSHTDDHIHFIQNFQSLLRPSGSPDLPSIVVGPLRYFRDVSDAVSDLRDKLENILKDTWPRISATGSWKEYETRNMSLQRNIVSSYMSSGIKDMIIYLCCFDSLFSLDCCPLSLDHNSVYKRLTLSEENRKVKNVDQDQMYPDHSDRFTRYPQVLCREGLSGRCYWELEWKGGYMFAAVTYKDIERTSGRSLFGNNDKSWSLRCSQRGYTFRHNKVKQEVSGPLSSRVGVYLDHEAGVLSFYSVSDTMTLLHKVSTTFTQPLYPGLRLDNNVGTSVVLMKLWCRMCRM
ncbi:E3 ubiquitin-protein ligase Midline-1-like [Polymixia lowei]